MTHWIQQSLNIWSGWFPLAKVFLVIFILDMERKLQVVEFFLGPSMARLALSMMARQRRVRSIITTTTPGSSTSTRNNKISVIVMIYWTSICSLEIFSGSFASRQWWLPWTRRVYRQCLTGRTHANFFSLRTSHWTARVAQGMMSLCESSQKHSLMFFSIFHLTDNTSDLSSAINWNQTKPVCCYARGWTLWPIGWSDPKHIWWNHRTSTPHWSETNGIADRAVRRVKEGTSTVLLQSGLDGKWWADSMESYCYLRNVQDLLADGKTSCERRFEEPFEWPIILFGAMVEHHTIFNVRFSKTSSIWQESLTRDLSWIWADRGVILERSYSDFGFGRFGKLDASEIYLRRINAKEVLITQKGSEFIFTSSRWYSKIVRKRLRIPRTHSKTETNRRERSFQWKNSRRIGRVPTYRNNRWRWSHERLLVDPRWLHLSSSRWTSSSSLCAEGRNIPYSTKIQWCKKVFSHWSGRNARETCRCSMATGKNQLQEGGISRSTKRQKECPLCYIDGNLSSQKCGVRTPIPEVRRKGHASRWHCKRRLWSLRSFYWTGLVCVPNDCRKSNGCYCKITRMWQTSSRRSISIYPRKIGGRSHIAPNSQVRMSRYLDTSTTTQMAEVLGAHWRSRGTSRTKFICTPISRIVVGKTIRGSSIDGKKYQIGNVCLFIENKDYSCHYTWMPLKWLESRRIWLIFFKTLILANQHHFLVTHTWDVLNVNANRMKLL